MIRQGRIFCQVGLVVLAAAGLLPAQTTINVNSTVIQSPVKRFGINLGTPNFYDSGQMTKNLVYTTNPSFEGEIYQSLIQCNGSGTANSCSDVNVYAGFPTGFWNNASYSMITGTSAGRSGSICSFAAGTFPANGGVYTFCDSGTPPASGDYMLVRMTMPADVGWPLGGDWLTTVGAGTFTAETTDLPPGTLGKQSGLLKAPSAGDSVSVNIFFDATAAKSFVQLNGPHVLTFLAKGVSGNMNVAVSLTRGANTFFNQTVTLTNSWNTYSIPFTGTENGSALTKVKLSFAAAGPDTIEIDDVSLTKSGTDPTNTTIFRDEVVQALQAAKPGVVRYWVDQLGDSLDNLLAPVTGRQRSGYTPYAGFDGTNITFVGGIPSIGTYQTQSVKVGLTEFLQLCQKVGADPWIVVPSTFTTGEAYNLIDYLAGNSGTPYGAVRIASGQSAPWTSVFNVIHLEFGNEEWNGGTFKGGAMETGSLSYSPYGVRAKAIFTAIKGNGGYTQSKFDLIINGQSASPYSNYFTQLSINNNDSFSIAPYMMYNISEWATNDRLFGTTFAEAEAFVTSTASAEGVSGGYITAEQNPATGPGKPIVTSEMNLSPTGTPPSGGDGPLTQAAMNGYASSIGGGIAVLDSMFQQLRAGVLTQNLFALPGYSVATETHTSAYLWGAVVDMGVTNLKRPQYLALQMANNAIGNKTVMLQTQQTGLNPTDNQYGFGLNSVSLATFHFLQSFAFTDGVGNYSLVVFNVSPDYSQPINFGGVQPSGTVNVQQLTSTQITDTNETSSVVNIQSVPFASQMTLPAFSMTTFTWGSSVQAGPVISNVTSTNVTANSATITWTTDQASSSQVNYGTTTSYGSQSALNSTLATSHSVTLTGLIAGTAYNFDVVSANSSNASSTSTNSTFTTPAAAPVISGVTSTPISSTSATITWTTDQASTSLVNYGTTTSYGSASTLDTNLVTSHSVTLTGLTAATTYNFDVVSKNAANQTATSANFTFATTSTGPVISAVTATAITSTSATITWTTDVTSSSLVNYGTTTSYGSASALNSTLVTSHSVTLTGLTPSTTYNYDVVSVTGASASSTSANFTFATTAAAAPVISGVTVIGITSNTATVSWTTDQASSSLVNYGTTTAYGSASTLDANLVTSHSVTLTGLTAATTYNFDVVSKNASNVTGTSANATFATSAAGAPVISSISAFPVANTTANINWVTDVNATSVVNYGLTTAYGQQASQGSTLAIFHSLPLAGLSPGTTYNYSVTSANASNATASSTNNSFTTSGAPAAPAISTVAVSAIGPNSVTITWATDQASTTQVAYGPSTSYGSTSTLVTALTTAHSVTLTGLTASSTYNFAVKSANISGLLATSANGTFNTTGPGPVLSAITATAITTTSATITWTTDQASSSLVNYGTTAAYGSASTLNSTPVTSHSVILTGLTPGTTYNYDVVSALSGGGSSTSANFTFATTTAAPPVISAVTGTPVSSTSATITWTTDQPSTTQVNYGTTSSYGLQSPLISTLTTAHSVTLTGLTQSTTYNFDVVSGYATGTPATSPNATFATPQTPPVISAVTTTSITPTGATITWTTDQASTTQVSYGTTTAYGSLSTLISTLATTHSVTLTGLTPNTAYNYTAVSGYATGTPTFSPNVTFTTTTATAPVISAVTATSITSTSATITWTTDLTSSSLVNYGTTAAYGSASALNSSLVTTHSVTLTGLTPSTTYNYDVVSVTGASGSATSPNFTFATIASAAPVISGINVIGITPTSATVTWTTDQTSSSLVNYGTTTAYGSASTLDPTLVTSHSVTLTGLTAGTTYNFDVVSKNASNVTATSPNATFATPGATAPVITSVSAFPVATNTASINWVTDVNATTVVNFGLTTAYGQQVNQGSAVTIFHSMPLAGLSPGTTYNFNVSSTGLSNATSSSTNNSFTTDGVPAPPVISTVAVSAISNNSATITWTTDQSSTTQVAYGPTTSYGFTSTLVTALTTTHSVTLTGLTPGTAYNVAAMSANISGLLATAPNTTFTTSGTAPAPSITNVTATAISSTSATITWTTDQAATSLVNYGTTTGYGTQSALNSTLVSSHSVTLTGLTPATLYNYDVVSANGGSASTTSVNFTFSTTAQPPPTISAVTANSITTTSATITWTTDQPTSSLVNYGTTTGYGSQSALNSTLLTSHSVTLTGLTPGTIYNFDVVSANSSSVSSTSSNSTFTTSAVAPVISTLIATSITTTSATITWTTDQPATSLVNYGTTIAYGSQSALNSTLSTSHSVALTGLTPGTSYNFNAVSTNSSNLTTTSGNTNSFTTTAVGPVISAVAATSITTTSASITWTTDQPTSSQVNYGTTTAYGSQSPFNGGLSFTHTVNLSGLTPGTTYNFDVVSTNSSNLTTTSPNATFSTTAIAPVISAVTSTGITATSATITWTTDQPTSSQVNYGTTTSYGSQSPLINTLVTSHSVTLSGLTSGTTYNFDVVSANSSSLSATSPNATFSTTAVAPVISAVTSTAITSTSATITWTTDQPSTSRVNYGTTTSYGSQSALNSTLQTSHSVTLTGLTSGTTYNFDVVSTNNASLTTTSPNATFATTAVAPVISAVTSTSISTISATITWTTDQPASSQVNYGTTTAYGLQSTLNSSLVTSHSVTLSGLTAGTTYNFDVVSTNAASLAATSANATFTTTANPPVISAVTSTSITPTSATINWTTDQPSSSRVNYGTTTAYGSQSALNSSLVTAHSVTLTGLNPTTTYNFDVVSANSTSISATSGNFTFATTTPPPPVISVVTATAIGQNSATITWTTDQASTSQVSYGTTPAYGSQSPLNGALTTAHSVTLVGLTVGTTYNFAVISGYATGTPTTSGNFTFATLTTPPPVISSVGSFPVANTTATILWTTDVNSTSQVNYGLTAAYGTQSALISSLGIYHNVPLSNLLPGTVYHYQVISTNSAGGTTTSGDFTFTTSGTAPMLFTNVTATGITSNSATITWTTNQASSSQVYYGTTPAYGTLSAPNPALVATHSVTLTGLTAGTTYNYELLSNTASVNGTSTNFVFTTSSAGPPVISAVTATPLNSSSAIITWTTDQASSTQVNYGLTTGYGSQSALNSSLVTSHSATLTGLTPGATYNYAVISTNGANQTTTSANFAFVSPTGAAAVISAVTATAITPSSATITWTTDQPTTSLVNYGTTTGYGSQSSLVSALSTTHSVTITGLTTGTTYNFDVVSANSSNTTSISGNFTFTTLVASGPVISSVAVWPVAGTTATILWTTDVAATSVVNYGTTAAYGQTSGPNAALDFYHAVPLSNLTQGTTYNYQIVTTNGVGVTTTSPNYTFTTAGAPPIIFTAVTASAITGTSATITWTTNVTGTSRVAYGTTLAYGALSALDNTQVFTHTVALTGLTPNTTYNFAALSTNDSAPDGTSINFTFSTSASGFVISAVTATSITSTSATITWTTNQPSSSLVNYGTTPAYGSQSPLNSSLVTSHSVTLTGLTAGTAYNFDVVSTNASSTSATSANSTFSTTAAAAPVISAVTATSITSTSATITWTTDQGSTSLVNYGTTTAYGSQSALNSSLLTSHSVTLTGLTAGTAYNFDVVSANASSTSATSANFTFSTTGAAAPVISAVTATSITTTSATITWTTDQAATSLVNYGATTAYGSQSPINASLVTSHSVTLTGLTPGATYNFDVVSANASNTTSTSGNFTFSTSSASTPAPVLSSMAAYPVGTTTATILWTTDQNSTSVVNYGTTTAYGQQTGLGTAMTIYHAVNLTGLTPGTTYNFQVVSTNSSSVSSNSGNFTFTTSGTAPGGGAGPVITAVTATGITNTSVTINWTTDQVSNSQVSYGLTNAYGLLSTLNTNLVTSHSATLTGLTPGTTYNYQVLSTNGTAVSAASNNFTFSTTGTVPAPVVSSVAFWGVTSSSVIMSWSTDQLANTFVTYGTTPALGQTTTVQTALVTSHGATLTGLQPNTTYYFVANSTNSAGTNGSSGQFSFTTLDSGAPVVLTQTPTPSAGNTASVAWTLSKPGTCQVEFGTDNSYGRWSQLTTALQTALGYVPSGTIHYRIHCMDSTGAASVTTDLTFIEP